MPNNSLLQLTFYFLIVIMLVKPLGGYIAAVYNHQRCIMDRILRPIEHFIYRLCQININDEMNWKQYLSSVFIFGFLSTAFVYSIQRMQHGLPFNPEGFNAVSPTLAFNTAASFATNTNWQNYAGEKSLSYLTQMLALTTQNFISAATSVAIVIALIRGLVRREANHIGNFWVDLTRGTLYIFLPLSIFLAIFLSSQGVIQTIKPYETIHTLESLNHPSLESTTQRLPMGPVASQIAIKQLGSNGGGFFNSNASHPFENPNPLTDFFEMLAILLIPAALCYTFGTMINDKRQGWALFAVMLIIFIPLVLITAHTEIQGNPLLSDLHVSSTINLEGKEIRFGAINSSLWATATTATSNGSVNAMHGSFMPLSRLIILWLMHVGEIIFGGAGSGLYGMITLVIIAVFIAGLMVGRTPEYLGKKIEPFEMKMASFAILILPLILLILTAIAASLPAGINSLSEKGPYGFTELLYAFTSMGSNNGSAMAGLNGNTTFYNVIGGIEMLLMRYWPIIPTLALAGSLARKKTIPANLGTLPTHTPLFITFLIAIIFITGALTFFPALALGPVVEHLTLWESYGH